MHPIYPVHKDQVLYIHQKATALTESNGARIPSPFPGTQTLELIYPKKVMSRHNLTCISNFSGLFAMDPSSLFRRIGIVLSELSPIQTVGYVSWGMQEVLGVIGFIHAKEVGM